MIVTFDMAIRMNDARRSRVQRLRRIAEQQVRTKFPELIRDSSGWHRAVDNRLTRLLRTSP